MALLSHLYGGRWWGTLTQGAHLNEALLGIHSSETAWVAPIFSGSSFISQRAAEGFMIAGFLKVTALRGGSGTYLLIAMLWPDQIL